MHGHGAALTLKKDVPCTGHPSILSSLRALSVRTGTGAGIAGCRIPVITGDFPSRRETVIKPASLSRARFLYTLPLDMWKVPLILGLILISFFNPARYQIAKLMFRSFV